METHLKDRLRVLDALFAERVLGYGNPGATWPLAPYTRSLDAAWEGAMRTGQFQYIGLYQTDDNRIKADVTHKSTPTDDGWCDVEERASHPAEALVLACLRAVGVDEKELS